MDIQALVTLVGATVVLALVPGPVVAALVGRALFGGITSTFGFIAGVLLGDLVWLVAAISGLGYVAATYSGLFLVVKYIGAFYLIYLGLQALRHAMQKNQEIKIPKKSYKGAGFVSGLLVTLGNPKLVAFYVGFLPTFIDMEALSLQEALWAAVLVPTTFASINFCWALSASRARSIFKSASPMRILNLMSGGLLVGAGVFMLSED